jgi:hypothetical protein
MVVLLRVRDCGRVPAKSILVKQLKALLAAEIIGTLDRLGGILNRLGSRVEVKVKIRPATNTARGRSEGQPS